MEPAVSPHLPTLLEKSGLHQRSSTESVPTHEKIMKPIVSFPEIETRIAGVLEEQTDFPAVASPTTSMDILMVYPGPQTDGNVVWLRDRNDDEITQFVANAKVEQKRVPLLTVFFLKSADENEPPAYEVCRHVRISLKTLIEFHNYLRFSPIFLELVLSGRYQTTTMGNFPRYDHEDELAAIDGFYLYCSATTGGYVNLCYSHDLERGSSTYFIAHLPEVVNEVISRVILKNPNLLLRPCFIDSIIGEYYLDTWQGKGGWLHFLLYKYEGAIESESPTVFEDDTVRQLHRIMRMYLYLDKDLAELEDRMRLVLENVKVLCQKRRRGDVNHHWCMEARSVENSLVYLLSITKSERRRVGTSRESTNTTINLSVGLAAQKDSRTNLKIADLTSTVAIDAQRDSAAMITIAAVTMFFLPGTFTCAVFSMVFFNTGVDANGRDTFSVSSRWWYFVAITIPLTMLVFIVWLFWTRHRRKRLGRHNGKLHVA